VIDLYRAWRISMFVAALVAAVVFLVLLVFAFVAYAVSLTN
jgi:hypothetical protein